MGEFAFSNDYMERLLTIKSSEFKENLFSNLRRLNEYMREDEYADVYGAIEEIVVLENTGNIIFSHGFGTYSEWLWKEPATFIQAMVEDLTDWFLFETKVLECRLFCMGIHIDDYMITDDDLEVITYGIMSNFMEQGLACPDVVLIPTLDSKKEMENGYFILGLK